MRNVATGDYYVQVSFDRLSHNGTQRFDLHNYHTHSASVKAIGLGVHMFTYVSMCTKEKFQWLANLFKHQW